MFVCLERDEFDELAEEREEKVKSTQKPEQIVHPKDLFKIYYGFIMSLLLFRSEFFKFTYLLC